MEVFSLAGGGDLVRELKGPWAAQQGSPSTSHWPGQASRGSRSSGREAGSRGEVEIKAETVTS